MNSDIRKFQLSNYHLVIVIICVFGFLLRIIGAINIAITPEEARILLSGLGGIDGIEAELSYLQQILIEMINGVFGKHLFMMRLPTILVGSLVILMPGFLKQEFDRKASIWLSAFLAIAFVRLGLVALAAALEPGVRRNLLPYPFPGGIICPSLLERQTHGPWSPHASIVPEPCSAM